MQDRALRFLKRALYPHALLLALLIPLSAAGLAAVFTQGWEESPFAYGVYVLSAYTLTAAAVRCVGLVRQARVRLSRSALYRRYKADLDFKTHVSLSLSLAVTLFYCVYKAAVAIGTRSAWFGSAAFYYLVLAVMRFLLLRQLRGPQRAPGQTYRSCRLCGYLLLVLTAALAAMSFHTIHEGRAARYPGHLIYAVAGYAFYSLTMAVVNLVRYRKRHTPIYTASKVITLAAALVSMFFLQASMFAAFGDGSGWQKYMNMGTGAFVFLLIAGMALFMILSSNRFIAALAMEPENP